MPSNRPGCDGAGQPDGPVVRLQDVVPLTVSRVVARVVTVLALAGCPLALVGCSASSTAASGAGPAQAGASWAGTRPTASVTAATPHGHRQFHRLAADVGRLLDTTLTGPVSGVTLRVWIWLPPQYDEPAHAHDVFPALMLYPGGTGAGHNSWAGTALGAREFVAAGAANRSTLPFVFVMPEMQVSPTLDTECADLPGQPKVGTFLAVDVRQMVLTNLRVSPDRVAWGAVGTSSGAYCAMRVVYNHPDQYAAVVSIDGYFTIDTSLPGNNDPTVRAGDPQTIATARPPAVSVLLWSGTSGHDLARARHFLTRVRPPTTAQLRNLPGAQHLTTDMARMIPDVFTYLSQRLTPPTPTSTRP
jgi:Putative esterase